MSVTATRRVQFCAGHRILGHESKCAHLHGHNYVALLTAEAKGTGLDNIGRVIDFSVLKERVGGWIDRMWDHGFLVYDKDVAVRRAITAFEGEEEQLTQKVYAMDENPTAENIAAHLLLRVGPQVLAGTGVRLVRVEVWETENCRAEAELL